MGGYYVGVDAIEKSSPITVIDSARATTTSSPVDARGKNAILVKIALSAARNWTIKLQGSFKRGGDYVDLYEQANTGNMITMSHQTDASKMILFKGIPDWIKVVATEDIDGAKCTVEVQLINV